MRVRRGFNQFMRWLVIPTMVAALVTQAAPSARADDPEADMAKAQNKLEYIRQQKEQVKNALSQTYWQAKEAEVKLGEVERDLAVANSQLAVVSNQLAAATQELTKVNGELETAKQQVAEHKDQLSRRLRAINEEGRVNYLSVLLGSATFSDLISRFDMLKLVVQKDAQLFADVRKAKDAVEQKQREAANRKQRMQDLKVQEEQRRNTIVAKRDERQQVSRSLESTKRSLQARYAEFDQAEAAVMDQVVEIQRRMNRKAGRFTPIFPVPKPVIVTDPFGPRLHPILNVWRPHNGTDFNAHMGAPVYAIEDGTVIVAGWNEAYGNLIVIDHGGGISSWYGHSSQLLVKVGDNVRQGQRISDAGSTGWSTGPHVHLEIRVDGKPQNPMNYLQQ